MVQIEIRGTKKALDRAYSSCFMHALVAHMRLPFFKIFSYFVHFCPNLQIFCPLLPFFFKIARVLLLSRIGLAWNVLCNLIRTPRNCFFGFFSRVSRSSRPDVFCKKGVVRNFSQFTGKHLCQSLFLIKFHAWDLQLC